MRKLDKAIIWPAYFDLNKTRKRGRRVARNLAVPAPKIAELQEAAAKLGLSHEMVQEKGYPKTPWSKPGTLLVNKTEPKEQLIKKIARQLLKNRNEILKTVPSRTK
jgi:signal recognition particle subunit SRP19